MSVVINDYTSNFTAKFINDPIYGGIGLSQLEVDIINTPIFQRLRNIKQLAYVNLVFPCAEHSRFVHSLGVLCIMGKMTEHLKARFPQKFKTEHQIQLRIAALLHDIGHYPLSHLGEGVYCFKQAELSLTKYTTKKGTADEKLSLLTRVSAKPKDKTPHHENLGKYIIENNTTIKAFLDAVGIVPAQIGDIVIGHTEPETMIYSQLMHSSLDADRLDYLLRDSFQTGVRYGLVDLDYIIRLLCIGRDKIKFGQETREVDVIACTKKGQHVIEHYLMSRYFHYSQVILHKTSLAFESVAKALFYKLVQKEKFIFNSYQEILDNINSPKFLEFTDSTLIKHIKAYYNETDDPDYKLFFEIVDKRKRPRTLIDLKVMGKRVNGDAEDFSYKMLNKILSKEPEKIQEILKVDHEHIGFQETKVHVEPIPTTIGVDDDTKKREEYEKGLREAVRIIDDSGKVTLLALDKKSLIHTVTDLSAQSLRVFYIEPDDLLDANKHCTNSREKLDIMIKP